MKFVDDDDGDDAGHMLRATFTSVTHRYPSVCRRNYESFNYKVDVMESKVPVAQSRTWKCKLERFGTAVEI